MSRKTAGEIRKLRDLHGRSLWADSLAVGQLPLLLGHPVEMDEAMPEIGPNALSVAFGDFRRAYLIVEKAGLKMLRDPFSSKPNMLLYAYRRVGGSLANGKAVNLIKFGIS